MNSKTASLIVLHHDHDSRVLKEMEGSDSSYYAGSRETKTKVKVIPATDYLLRNELEHIGLVIADLPTVRKVAQKFSSELIQRPGGSLAWDQVTNQGFFEILFSEKQS